jgi:integrase
MCTCLSSAISTIRGIKLRQGKYLFTGPESLRMETASDLWLRKLGHMVKAAKLPGVHPHRFRRTFAAELLKKRVPMEEVSCCSAIDHIVELVGGGESEDRACLAYNFVLVTRSVKDYA